MTADLLLGMVTVLLVWSCVAVLYLWRRLGQVEEVLRKQCVFNEVAGREIQKCVRREELN